MGGERLVVVTAIALVAIVRFGQESTEGVAAAVMAVLLDEENLFVRGHLSLEDDHVRGIDGHDLDLVAGQRGLESRQFGDVAGSFGYARQSMEFFGQPFLTRSTIFQRLVPHRGNHACLFVGPGSHGDDGAGAAQGISVLDADDGVFDESSAGRRRRFVAFAVASAGTRGADEGRFHVEGVVGGEGLVRVECLSQGLQVRGQPFPVLSDFAHAKGGGLEGVVECPGLHGEMQRRMRRQGGVCLNLS